MNFKKIAGLTMWLAGSFAGAQEFSEADNYPVNFSKCDYIVTVPEGSGGFRHSRDCKTVYILPDRKGKFEAKPSLNRTFLKSMCPLFEANQKRYLQKSDLLIKILDQINILEISGKNPQELLRLEKAAARLQKELVEISDPYRNVEGGKAGFTLQASLETKTLNEYYNLNRQLLYQRPIKFEPMPVQNGYLTLTEYKPEDKTQFPSSIGVYVNGILVKGEGTQQNIYKMKSSMAGQIVLGLTKACDLYNIEKENLAVGVKLTPEQLGAELIAELGPNYSYTYPVMSTVSYKADIEMIRATELVFDSHKVKTQFKLNEFSTMLGEGSASDIFRMEINLGDLGDRYTTPEDRQSFLSKLTADVRGRLAEKFLRELETVKVVKFEKDASSEVPNPGYITEPVGSVRRCSSDYFLGIRVGGSCYDQVITRTVEVAGQLNEVIKQIQDLKINVDEQVNIRELVLHGENVIF